jgi:hypothetical protein
LPSFCGAPHRNYPPDGFKTSSIRKLDEFDAHWFMRAVDSNLVVESEGFFVFLLLFHFSSHHLAEFRSYWSTTARAL